MPLAYKTILTKPSIPRARDPEELARYIKKSHIIINDTKKALKYAKSISKKELIIVTGSIYTVGEALKQNKLFIYPNYYLNYAQKYKKENLLKIIYGILFLPVAFFPMLRCYFKVPYIFCKVCPRKCPWGELYTIIQNNLVNSICAKCGEKIAGVWEA